MFLNRWILCIGFLFFSALSLGFLGYDLPLPSQEKLESAFFVHDEKILMGTARSVFLYGDVGIKEYTFHNLYFSLIGSYLPVVSFKIFGMNPFALRLPFFLINLLGVFLLVLYLDRLKKPMLSSLFVMGLLSYEFFYLQHFGILDTTFNTIFILLIFGLVRFSEKDLFKWWFVATFPIAIYYKAYVFVYGSALFFLYLLVFNRRKLWIFCVAYVVSFLLYYKLGEWVYESLLPADHAFGYLKYHQVASQHLRGAVVEAATQFHTIAGWRVITDFLYFFNKVWPVLPLWTLLISLGALMVLKIKRSQFLYFAKKPKFIFTILFLVFLLAFWGNQMFYLKRVIPFIGLLILLFCEFYVFLDAQIQASKKKLDQKLWLLSKCLVGLAALMMLRPLYDQTKEIFQSEPFSYEMMMSQQLDALLPQELSKPGYGINVAAHTYPYRFTSFSQKAHFFTGDDQHVPVEMLVSYALKEQIPFLFLSVEDWNQISSQVPVSWRRVGEIPVKKDYIFTQDFILVQLELPQPNFNSPPTTEMRPPYDKLQIQQDP